jgi:hypothetical protein
MAAAGRILIGGRDCGAGVAISPRIAITAYHVIRKSADQLIEFSIADYKRFQVERFQADEERDIAALYFSEVIDDWLPVSTPAIGAKWRATSAPPGNDPVLTGTVTANSIPIVNAKGHQVKAIQLKVDQLLGDYHGYSGSGVLDSLGKAVFGVLVEQKELRNPVNIGQLPQAANVLYALSLKETAHGLGIKISTARPRRFAVARMPFGMVERPDLLDNLIDKVINRSKEEIAPVVRLWGPGGMGKTILARLLAYDERIWRAFPDGIFEVAAGKDATAKEAINSLISRFGGQTGDLWEAMPESEILMIIDDVWNPDFVEDFVAGLPENITILVTTRGTPLVSRRLGRSVTSVQVGAMKVDESIRILARDVERTAELDTSLEKLAQVLGNWPLLLDMAATELHGDEYRDDDDDDLRMHARSTSAAKLMEEAHLVAEAFSKDPTRLDDADNQRRSFDKMVRRSHSRLSQEDQGRFLALAIYPAGAKLSQPTLSDLWRVDEFDTRKHMRTLRRVGLTTMSGVEGPVLRFHDLITAWLHRECGAPDDPRHHPVHKQLVSLSIGERGAEGELTVERANWLVYHLRHTGVLNDAARIIESHWRLTYRHATGHDTVYMSALREVSQHYARLSQSDTTSDDDRFGFRVWAIEAGLLHAHISTLVGATPVEALTVQAILGQPEAALRQAAGNPDPHDAVQTLVRIVDTLNRHQVLTIELIKQIETISKDIRDDESRLIVLLHMIKITANNELDIMDRQVKQALDIASQLPPFAEICRMLSDTATVLLPKYSALAKELLEQAEDIADQISDEMERARALSAIAAAFTLSDVSERAIGLFDRAVDDVRAITDDATRGIELAAVADVMFESDSAKAERLFSKAVQIVDQIPDSWGHSFASSAVVSRLIKHNPDQAADMVRRMGPSRARDDKLKRTAIALCSKDIDRALLIADLIYDRSLHRETITQIAVSIAETNPKQSHQLLDQAVSETGQIKDEYERYEVIAEIASAIMSLDQQRSLDLLNNAIATAKSIRKTTQRDRALNSLVKAMAAIDPEIAADLTNLISSDHGRSQAILTIIPSMVEKNLERALELAEQIPRTSPRSKGMAILAQALSKKHKDRARQLCEESVRLADQIGDNAPTWPMAKLVSTIAETDPLCATNLLSRIGYPQARIQPLLAIARALFSSDPDRAYSLFQSALKIANETKDDRYPGRHLVEIVKAMISYFPEEALTLAEEVAQVADYGDLTLVSLAIAASHPKQAENLIIQAELSDTGRCISLARLGETVSEYYPELAKDIFRRAIKYAERIDQQHRRQSSILDIAVSMRESDPEYAAELAKRVSVNTESDRHHMELAMAVARIDPERAASYIDAIKEGGIDRAVALAELSRALLKSDSEWAHRLLDEAADNVIFSNVEDHARAFVRTTMEMMENDPARTLDHFTRIPDDGRRRMVLRQFGLAIPRLKTESLHSLGGYMEGLGESPNIAGSLPDAWWHLHSTLEYVTGFLVALQVSKAANLKEFVVRIFEVVVRFWPEVSKTYALE